MWLARSQEGRDSCFTAEDYSEMYAPSCACHAYDNLCENMPLTLQEAQKILTAAEARARELGLNVSISVVDARGDLVASVRMDGARFFMPDVSRGKAMASAIFGQPSGELTERGTNPVLRNLNLMNQGIFIFGQGAVPLIRAGVVDGAVGVSGGPAEQDEDVARAGILGL